MHRLPCSNKSACCPWHGIDVMGERNHMMNRGISQNLGIRLFMEIDFSNPRDFDCRLLSLHTTEDVLVKIVVSQEPRPAHCFSRTEALRRRRSRSTTGLGFCSALCLSSSHSFSWRSRYWFTDSRLAR